MKNIKSTEKIIETVNVIWSDETVETQGSQNYMYVENLKKYLHNKYGLYEKSKISLYSFSSEEEAREKINQSVESSNTYTVVITTEKDKQKLLDDQEKNKFINSGKDKLGVVIFCDNNINHDKSTEQQISEGMNAFYSNDENNFYNKFNT